MAKNYAIDSMHGNQLCAGLQGYEYARKVAEDRARTLRQTVYLYSDETDAEAIDPPAPTREEE